MPGRVEVRDGAGFPSAPLARLAETLRSMLLNAYGWWKVSQITYIISLAAFGLGTLSFLAGLFGFASLRHDRKLATATAPAIEQITDAGHPASA